MGVTDKLRWKRLLNELKFLHEERELIESICKETAPLFQCYYEEYCQEHAIDLQQLNQQHSQHIQKIYNKKKAENPSSIPFLAGLPVLHKLSAHTDDNSSYEMTKDEIEIHEAFRKVFHKLALLLHPDKLPADLSSSERRRKLTMFKNAKNAFDERQYFILLDLAQDFDIKVPRNYRQQSKWMKREIARLEEEVEHEKKTYNYRFGECETKEDKDRVIRSFMKQLFGFQISQNNA